MRDDKETILTLEIREGLEHGNWAIKATDKDGNPWSSAGTIGRRRKRLTLQQVKYLSSHLVHAADHWLNGERDAIGPGAYPEASDRLGTWIRVEDQMPVTKDGRLLAVAVAAGSGKREVIKTSYSDHAKDWMTTGGYLSSGWTITHWMLYPALPWVN